MEATQSTLQPRFVNAEAMILGGVDKRYSYQESHAIPEQWKPFGCRIVHIPNQVGKTAYGVCHHMDAEGMNYMAGVQLSGTSEMPDDFTAISFPAQRYAVFTHDKHVSQMRETLDAIWKDWLPRSGLKADEALGFFERYGEGFSPQTGMGDMEIWVPLEEKIG